MLFVKKAHEERSYRSGVFTASDKTCANLRTVLEKIVSVLDLALLS